MNRKNRKHGKVRDHMDLTGKNIGVALTGSFCTFDKAFRVLEGLKESGAILHPILSDSAQQISSRFGTPKAFLERIRSITGREPILTIEAAEPLGPAAALDALAIIPCTGNTAAKLAGGITDSPVLMAAKAVLRVGNPLVIAISTNDGLGMNLKNIGLLLNAKNVYFVPFGQDNWEKKPNSLVAHLQFLQPTLEFALEHRQYQPVLISHEQLPSERNA